MTLGKPTLSPVSKLGELLDLVIDYRGKTPKKLGGDFTNSGIPVISAIHIKRGKIVWEERERFVTKDMFQKWMKDPLKKGDVLLTSEAPLGEVALVPNDDDLVLSQRLFALRTKSELLDSRYLMYFFQSKIGQEELKGRSSGSTVVGIRQTELVNISVPCPPIANQRVVGEVLAAIDAKISANEALSKTLEVIAQTTFKSWFIDFDPVKAKMAGEKPAGMDDATAALFPDSMEESELGIVPSGWKVTKLSSSLKLHKSTVKAGASTESVPYVPVDQIGAKDIFLKNSMPGSAAKTSLVSFRKNDILFGAMRPYFHKVVLAPFDGTTRTTTFVLRVINSNYLSHSLFTVNQENAVAFATNNSQGTTIPYAVWNNSFEDFPMVLPPEPTAKAFNDLVLPIIEYGYSLIAQNRSLVEIRNGLLPRLISGELQIPDEMLAS